MSAYADKYGPWALVVGGSAGIGAGCVVEAAARGLNVVSVARREHLLARQKDDVERRFGVQVLPVVADLAEDGAATRILEAVDGLDIGLFAHVAAIEPRGYFLELPAEQHEANVAVNITAPTRLAYALGGRMVARGRGGIVLVSSLGALQGAPVFASYFAAKAYLWILAEGLWAELGESGVDVTAYLVGRTATETYKGTVDGSDRPADPADVGRRILDVVGAGPTCFVDEADEAMAVDALARPRRAAVERSMAHMRLIRR